MGSTAAGGADGEPEVTDTVTVFRQITIVTLNLLHSVNAYSLAGIRAALRSTAVPVPVPVPVAVPLAVATGEIFEEATLRRRLRRHEATRSGFNIDTCASKKGFSSLSKKTRQSTPKNTTPDHGDAGSDAFRRF